VIENVTLLVERVLAGEDELFAQVIQRYERAVWSVVAAMLYDRREALDVMQEAFVSAYMHLDQFDRSRDFEKWIKQIARNTVRKRLRTAERQQRHLQRYREQVAGVNREAGERVEERDAAALAALADCRRELPQRWASAVEWRYEQGRSFDEIAKLLETTAAAAEKLISRARVRLRDCVRTKLAAAQLE
jgi:RNA polymerase sigma-70 factor (ECF subfamily)